MDAEKVEKVCKGLDRHKDGICQAKDGSICPYWEIDARCSRVMMDDALSVIRELKAENERLRQEKADAVERIERCRQNCISSEKDCDSALDREGKEINRAKAYAYQWVLNIINKPSI